MSDKSSKNSTNEVVEEAKRRASNDREVIIKNGTKMVKVRKRKRRKQSIVEQMQQAEDHEKKGHVKLLLSVMGIFVLSAIAVAGISFFKVAFYNSPDHIIKLENALSQKLHGETAIETYRFGPSSTIVRKFNFNSASPELPKLELSLSDIEIPHSPQSLVYGKLEGGSAIVEKATLSIDYQSPERGKLTPESEIYKPYAHSTFISDNLDIHLKTGSPSQPAVLNAEANLVVTEGNERLILRNGELKNIKGLPLELINGCIVNHPEHLEITQFKLGNGSSGFLDISGNYQKALNSSQKLQANFDGLRLESVSEVLQDIVEARVSSSDGIIEFAPIENQMKLTANLQCSRSGFTVRGLEFLSTIGELFGEVSYPQILFSDKSKVTMIVDNKGYLFKEIDLEKIGVMTLSGDFSLSHEGEVSGKLQVGVPLALILKFYPDVDRQSLTTNRSFAIFDIELSGTTRAPKDNFREQFNSAVDALQ